MEMCFRFHFNRKQSIQFTQLRARSIIYCTWLTAAEAAAIHCQRTATILVVQSVPLLSLGSDSVAGDISKPRYTRLFSSGGRSKQANYPQFSNPAGWLVGRTDDFGHSHSNRGEYCFVSCYVAVVEYYSMGILP